MLHGIRILALAGMLLTVACGPDQETLLRSFSADWRGVEMAGGMRIQLEGDGRRLVGLAPDGAVQDTMSVEVTRIDPGARRVHLRRLETDAQFTLELLEPAEDGRSRIRVDLPDGRRVTLVFQQPLPDSSS